MARKKRFRALKAALKYLQPIHSADQNQVVQAPQNTQLKQFQDYKGGSLAVHYTRSADSATKGLSKKKLKLFGADTTDSVGEVKISNRALLTGSLTAAGVALDKLGLDVTTDITFDGDFIPAKAHINSRTITGDAVQKESKLTGRKYKTKGGTAYCYPFGQITGSTTYSKQCQAIKALVNANIPTGKSRSVSFLPEDLLQ